MPRLATINLWDARTYQEKFTFSGSLDPQAHPAFSPDGRLLVSAVGGDDAPNESTVWDVQTGQVVRTLPLQPQRQTKTVVFSHDGRRILAMVQGELKAWDAITGRQVALGEDTARGATLAISSDGRRLFAEDGGGVKVWDAQTGKELLTLRPGLVTAGSLAFSTKGHRLAAADGLRRTVLIWDSTPSDNAPPIVPPPKAKPPA
jgi:WD40 repeat protein